MTRSEPYHHANLRQTLLDAAVTLIGEVGPRAFTLREVARRAGVPVGLAVAVRADGPHTLVRAALIVPWAVAGEEPLLDLRLFAHGSHGRLRAAVAAAAFLAEILQRGPSGTP